MPHKTKLERRPSKTICPQREKTFDLRKDGAAQGGWHGEGPHRETTLRQWPFSPDPVDLGTGRHQCELRTVLTCRHPDCGSLSRLSTAHSRAGQDGSAYSCPPWGILCLQTSGYLRSLMALETTQSPYRV